MGRYRRVEASLALTPKALASLRSLAAASDELLAGAGNSYFILTRPNGEKFAPVFQFNKRTGQLHEYVVAVNRILDTVYGDNPGRYDWWVIPNTLLGTQPPKSFLGYAGAPRVLAAAKGLLVAAAKRNQ